MAVAQLYHHVAPRTEVIIVAKALIRLLRGHKEVQSVVLTCIASMSLGRKGIFEQYMKSFFVRTSDPTHIKLLKLEILTNLATEINISVILREFQTYISSNDKDFVAATIQAIGRCAASISEVTETCLSGLVHLLSNRDEHVVAESVVVIKKLLQTQVTEHFEIISQMAKLLDFITVAAARAAILWLIGEYNERVPKIAPDVLRKLAKTFVDEADVVKLQVLNLAVKLFLTNADQTNLLCQYIFNLARFDENYDIRDRARFLKQFIFPTNENSVLARNARKIFLAKKPAPSLESKHENREQFQLGSLSHYINMRATGYHDLPGFPEVAPDQSVRFVAPEPLSTNDSSGKSDQGLLEPAKSSKSGGRKGPTKKKGGGKSFYSESEKSSSEYSSMNGSGSSSEEEDEEDGGSGSELDSASEKTPTNNKTKKIENNGHGDGKVSEDSEEDSSSSSDDEDGKSSSDAASSSTDSSSSSSGSTDDSSSKAPRPVIKKVVAESKSKLSGKPSTTAAAAAAKSNLDLLLDLDDIPPMPSNLMTPSLGGFLSPLTSTAGNNAAAKSNGIELIGPLYFPLNNHELLNKVNGYGLGITYRFTRAPHLASSTMISFELIFTNHGTQELKDIQISAKNLPAGMSLNEFSSIGVLAPASTMFGTLGIDFNDSTQPANFTIRSSAGASSASIRSPIGELVRAISIATDPTFFGRERAKLRGMNEHSCTIKLPPALSDLRGLQQRIYEVANVASFPSEDANRIINFVGQTITSKSLVLMSIELKEGTAEATLIVNCEKMVVGSMLMNEIKGMIQK